jgi:uncharacterized membrane protein
MQGMEVYDFLSFECLQKFGFKERHVSNCFLTVLYHNIVTLFANVLSLNFVDVSPVPAKFSYCRILIIISCYDLCFLRLYPLIQSK